MRRALVLALCLAPACATEPTVVENLALTRVSADMTSRVLTRVGLLPMTGVAVDDELAIALQASLASRFAMRGSFEVVSLTARDLEEVPQTEPFRRGSTHAETVVALARRFRLDGLLIADIAELRPYEPLRLGLAVDLVSCDTGRTLWSASVRLDTSEERVRAAIDAWCEVEGTTQGSHESWELIVLSPRRLSEFAAAQIAAQLPVEP